ncbi:hypothetical protein DPX16_23591 [Anabarilius grahami]|uniref:Uncharacterized protein n=1 Tax=Anabarilius grahami TaxID=495550 RepID=A0A3N0XSE0_ANAGA|nr:hypothetical protein DPX16_23591 [Anabarilius grahami]
MAQAQTRHCRDRRLIETQDRHGTTDESKPELQEELQRLPKGLAELHLEVERRELLEKESRKELTGKLQGEALQAKAEAELKERHAKARACENHLKQARRGVMAPKQQRDYLNDELDTGYRELKSDMGGETQSRTPVIGTQAEIVGDRWLVHTPTHTATLTYHQHDIATHVSLPHQSMWIQVPPDAITQLNNLASYHLSSEEDQSELEIPSSSRNHNHTLDPGLELRIEKGGSQLSDITPVDTVLQALSRLPILTSSLRAQAWTATNMALW